MRLSGIREGNGEAMDIELGRIEAMVFDVDGTLIDSAYEHTLAWTRAFKEAAVEVPTWWIHRHVGMGGDHLVEARMTLEVTLTVERTPETP